MKLSTGRVAFPIEFDNGDKAAIYFNPNDPNLSIRLADFHDKITAKVKELEDMTLNAAGEPEDHSVIEDFRKFQNILFEELDIAFGGKVSEVVFKHCSPFAIVDGNYFIMQFVEAIKPEIEKHIKKANADIEKKMAKHTNKYKK
jgi:hypothetical protein